MLQAKGYEDQTGVTSALAVDTEPEPFPYGWRYVKTMSPSGEESYEQIPLTLDDFFNPQEGDRMPQGNEHFQLVVDLITILKNHYLHDPTMGVFGDLIMDWGIPGLSKPAPDVAVVPNLKNKNTFRGGTFKVARHKTRPCLVIEVMSPRYPGDDTRKVDIYEQAGVPEYFLIKSHSEQDVLHYQLSGYRLVNGVYHSLFPKPNPWGRVLTSETLQLQFSVENQGRQVQVTDLKTGQPLLTAGEIQAARLAAEARAEAEAKARAELERRLQELESLLRSRS